MLSSNSDETYLILLVEVMRKLLLDHETSALTERLSDSRLMLSGHRILSSGRAAIQDSLLI